MRSLFSYALPLAPRLCVAAAAVAVTTLGVPAAHAQTITLFNTGVDNSNALLAGGVADPHYTMIANNVGLTNGIAALVNSNQQVGTYVQNSTSKYISPDGVDGGTPNSGNYTLTYRTTFTLPVNVVLSSVNITGGWSTDNTGNNILINGNSTAFSSPVFTSFTAFTLPTTFFTTGTNTLDFQWTNSGGPGGLNVVYTTKTFSTANAGGAAPEPGSIALALTGSGPLLLGLARRRKATKQAAQAQ